MFKGSSVSSYGKKEEKISDSEAAKLKADMKFLMNARRERQGKMPVTSTLADNI